MANVTTIDIKLNSLNHIHSIWQFNSYLRVTYVAPDWIVVWDHRQTPPARYDFKATGDHDTACRLAAEQLRILAPNYRE